VDAIEPTHGLSLGLEMKSRSIPVRTFGTLRGMSLHETARRGFASAADVYEESRPGYPEEAIGWLARELELGPGRTVVDLAAGTGKLTRLLTPTGATVIAIEPVDEMRAALPRTTPTAAARAGTAERTGLPDASADAVTVAQAFHWFDGPAALAEIHRVLRPGSRLALIWNVRDLDHPTQYAVEEVFAPYRGDTPSHRSGRWREALEETTLFRPTARTEFPNVQTLDAAGLVHRVASTSFVAELPAAERERLLDRVRGIATELPGRFPFPYTTEIELFDRASLT
jgi:ubiquinone/menaquinone biosynthesis C-methylase UbiE